MTEHLSFPLEPKVKGPEEERASQEVVAEVQTRFFGIPTKINLYAWQPLKGVALHVASRVKSVWAAITATTKEDSLDRKLKRTLQKSDQQIKEQHAATQRLVSQQSADDQSTLAKAQARKIVAGAIRDEAAALAEIADAAKALRGLGVDIEVLLGSQGVEWTKLLAELDSERLGRPPDEPGDEAAG
ncbi:MAG: hypothetical protein AAF682_32065 [Planctomycetota bacterium]